MAGSRYACDDDKVFLCQKTIIYLLVAMFMLGPYPCSCQDNLWPLPQSITTARKTLQFISKSFSFVVTGHSCDILDAALVRWWHRTFPNNGKQCCSGHSANSSSQPELKSLKVKVKTPCVGINPSLESDESCKYYLF